MLLNLNVGILGHVDSGKTSLAKLLTETPSTACFDKNPQSQSRGITLDLGFSSLTLPQVPAHLADREISAVQFTLVDCPGHASLIRTIIGGAQIIDFMLLVIDITKGIQTQTAECLIIGEITCDKLIVVLNKVDLLPAEEKDRTISKMTKRIQTVLSTTKFKNSPFITTSAHPDWPCGMNELIESMKNLAFLPERDMEKPFIFAVDHCFGIKGQGTVMTGTVLQGSIHTNDMVEIRVLNTTKKIKSMQMFRKPTEFVKQGDRVGICVTQFDPSLLERGIISSPNVTKWCTCAISQINPIKYYKFPIKSKTKFHITIGHETVMASILLFSTKSKDQFNMDDQFKYEDEIDSESDNTYYTILEFQRPVIAVANTLLIGSKLDLDVHGNVCRLAFAGNLLEICEDKNYKTTFLSKLKIYKTKQRTGFVERVVNERELIVKSMFKQKKGNLNSYIGLKVMLSTGQRGAIASTFGQSGKVKVFLDEDLEKIETNQKVDVVLNLKRFIFDPNRRIIQ